MSTYTIYFDYSEAAVSMGDDALELLPATIKHLEDTMTTAGCTFTSVPTSAGLACKFAYPDSGIQELVDAHMARSEKGVSSLPMKLVGKVAPALAERAAESTRAVLTANIHREVDALIESLLVGLKELSGATVFKDSSGIFRLPTHSPEMA